MLLKVLSDNTTRTFFLASTALIIVAFLELIAQFFGATLINNWYSPGRLLELAATLLVFVIALLLRDVRNELKLKRD